MDPDSRPHPFSLTLELDMGSEANARSMEGALTPELGDEVPRTRTRSRLEGSRLVLTVEAGDLVALRAAMNSYLNWAMMSSRLLEN